MKQLIGTAENITGDILGRITKSGKNIFNRKDTILVSADASSVPFGYTALITSQTLVKSSKPVVCGIKDMDAFNEGDVVLINREGVVSFLYERKSSHNAIFVTERCNHRCIMCPQPPVATEIDKTPMNLKLISLIDKSAEEIGITGGEPTLLGDNLFVLIKEIQKHQPKAAISLLSNGVKFAEKEYAKKLAMCGHFDLQVDVPIFSDIADIHNHIVGAKTFYKTVEGLYNLASYRIPIGLRIVIHKLTYKRLPQLADYIYHNFPFVSQVAFMQMETTGMADKNIEDLWIDPYDYNEELKQAVLLLENRGVCAKIYNAQLCVLPEELREFAVSSISDWKDIYLDECVGCKLKESCGGLFASNMNKHSEHIKQIRKYTPMPKPINNIQTISPFVEKHLTDEKLREYKNPSILDIPCGYGRHLQWLADRGYPVTGVDLDNKALKYNEKWKSERGYESVNLIRQDIDEMLRRDKNYDIVINIHLYSSHIFTVLKELVKPGGLLIIETPEIHGNNYLELPTPNYIYEGLLSDFEVIEYVESKECNSHVSVKVIAKRKK